MQPAETLPTAPSTTSSKPASKLPRYILVIIGLVVIIGGLGFVKFSQISMLMGFGKQMAQAGPPPEAVSSTKAEEQAWEGTLSAVGSVVTAKGVSITNDAAGVVSRISFESGDVVKQGQLLVELDTSVERAQLASAKARRDLAELNAKRSRALVQERVIAQSQLDTDEAEVKSTSTEYAAIAAQIERKIVRAPFAGRLGRRSVNLGQYLAPGTMLTELEAEGALYIDFSLPQQALAQVKVGMSVRLSTEDGATFNGAVDAVDPTVDNVTRALRVRSSVEDPESKLRPGMFVTVEVVLPSVGGVVAVPTTAVVYAPYGDSIFAVVDKPAGSPGTATTADGKTVKSAEQRFVRLGQARGDFVAILDGVKAGEEIVSAGAFKLRNGASIVVDNSVQAKAELNPRPENK